MEPIGGKKEPDGSRTRRSEQPVRIRARVRPYTTVPLGSLAAEKVPLYPSLTGSADRALSALRHFPNFHEAVTPGLHPFGEGISMVGWNLSDRSV